MTTTFEEEMQTIERFGWQQCKPGAHERCDMIWFRWFAGEPQCTHNEGKRTQIALKLYDHRHAGHRWGYELNLTACPPGDNGWCCFTMYGLGINDIEPNIDRLLKAWRAAQK